MAVDQPLCIRVVYGGRSTVLKQSFPFMIHLFGAQEYVPLLCKIIILQVKKLLL